MGGARQAAKGASGIKAETVNNSVYLLPSANERVRVKAALRRQSVHNLFLDALDLLFERDGEPPLERYSEPRPAKGGAPPRKHLSPAPSTPPPTETKTGGGRGIGPRGGPQDRPAPRPAAPGAAGSQARSRRGQDRTGARDMEDCDGDGFDLSRYLPPAEERGGPAFLYISARPAASVRERARMFDALGEAAGARGEGLAFAAAPALERTADRAPRGVPWRHYPALADARLRVVARPGPVLWLDDGPNAAARVEDHAPWDTVRRRAAAVVVDPWAGAVDAQEAAEAAASAAAFLTDPERGLAAVGSVALVGPDGHVAWEAAPAEAAGRLAADGRPGLRFGYSWRLNAAAVLGRALAEATRRAPEEAGWKPAARGEPLSDPLALQLLFRLARGPVVPDGDAHRRWPHRADGAGGGRVFLAPGRMESVVWNLRGAGLVTLTYGSPDLLRLTELGAAFLELLDPSGDDPGVLGRWRDPETGVVPASAVPEMDAWLARFFGRTKDRLLRLGIR